MLPICPDFRALRFPVAGVASTRTTRNDVVGFAGTVIAASPFKGSILPAHLFTGPGHTARRQTGLPARERWVFPVPEGNFCPTR